jgi:uncharacterized cupin superfamily protein
MVVPEAPLETTETGAVPGGDGWFVLNARDARWYASEAMGFVRMFEGENARFAQFGINLNVLRPGEPMSMYHGEAAQEDFLVLSGTCAVIVEGQERMLRAWDFVHCPPWTEHVFVGTGDAPCVLLAVGARGENRGLRYPVNEVALRHGAGVEKETSEVSEAYARFGRPTPTVCPAELPAA